MSGLRSRIACGILALAALGAGSAAGQGLTNGTQVLDETGGWTGEGTLSNLCAAGQPGGIAVSTGGPLANFAGFLNAFALCPELDTDGDGATDEFDLDNDADGLSDTAELSGSAFAPQTPTGVNDPDSDADGFSDGQEAAAGTHPGDAGAYLRITSVARARGVTAIGWLARSNVTYFVWSEPSLAGVGGFTNLAGTATAHGRAAAPWYATTNYFFDLNAPNDETGFYRVEVAH